MEGSDDEQSGTGSRKRRLGAEAAEHAFNTWSAFLQKHFSPAAAGLRPEDAYPTASELRHDAEKVVGEIPMSALRQLRALSVGLQDTEQSTPLVSVEEALRAKRARVDEFHYRRMGKAVPTASNNGFYYEALRSAGALGADLAETPRNAGSEHSFQLSDTTHSRSSARSGSVSYTPGKRTKSLAHYAGNSPHISKGSSRASDTSSNASKIVPRQDGAPGPKLSGGTDKKVVLQQVNEQCIKLLMAIKGNSITLSEAQRQASRLMRFFIRQKKENYASDHYQFDGPRAKFAATADMSNVKAALKRTLYLSKSMLPQRVSRPHLRPIIFVPGSVTSAINIYNAKMFLGFGKWVDPMKARQDNIVVEEVLMKVDRPNCPFNEFLIRDSIKNMKKEDWQYVCAIFVSGQAWQFEGFFNKSGADQMEPRDVLSRIAGFHVEYEDEQLHPNVTKWNLHILRVSKNMNRRHKDIKTVEDFWRALLKRMPFIRAFRPYFSGQ
eukprot:Sspe_Gene.53772::Locus_29693_Transcript_1_1_Confidence_1.000_Length_1656::g.53772::m.53772/K15175/CDC73; parafibromin